MYVSWINNIFIDLATFHLAREQHLKTAFRKIIPMWVLEMGGSSKSLWEDLFLNSFIEMWFTYHTIHSLKYTYLVGPKISVTIHPSIHHHRQFWEISINSRRNPISFTFTICVPHPLPLLQNKATMNLLSIFMGFLPGLSYKFPFYMVCGLPLNIVFSRFTHVVACSSTLSLLWPN